MPLADLSAEERRVCNLENAEAARWLAGEKPFLLYLVGSLTTGEAWPTSDFDFVIDAEEPLPGKVINPLREALELLRVPYTIDLVDWHRCSEAFREVAGPPRVALDGEMDALQNG